MYTRNKLTKTTISRNTSYKGETIEQKIRRVVNNKEPITDGAPLIYEERGAGVSPAHDIKTDRFEIAVEAMDKITKTNRAKREERAKLGKEAKEAMNKEAPPTPPIEKNQQS